MAQMGLNNIQEILSIVLSLEKHLGTFNLDTNFR